MGRGVPFHIINGTASNQTGLHLIMHQTIGLTGYIEPLTINLYIFR